MTVPLTKTCSRCLVEKPAAAFSRRTNRPIGLQSKCRECASAVDLSKRAGTAIGRGANYVQLTAKTCTVCGETKPLTDFHRRNGRAGGHVSRCRTCTTKSGVPRTLLGPKFHGLRSTEKVRYWKYGITPEEFTALLESQGGVCATCGGPPNGRGQYHLDHCHATGKIRGVLCHKCNVALGMVGDEPDRLRALIAYLERRA